MAAPPLRTPPDTAPEMVQASPLSRPVRSVRRRVALGLVLSETAVWGAIGLFLAGAVVLVGRSLTGAPWSAAFLALLAVPPVVLLRVRGRGFTDRDAAAWLDVSSGGAGWLVAQAELGADPAWAERLERGVGRAPDPPRPRVGRALGRLAPALLFAGLAAWVELPEPAPSGPPSALLRSLIGSLEGRLGFLEEELALDDAVVRDLRERLARLAQGVDEGSTEGLFAALDAIEEGMSTEADFARRAAESLLGRIASGAGGGGDLGRALEDAARRLEESGLGRALAPELLERLANAGLELGDLDLGGPELGGAARLAQQLETSEWLRESLERKFGELALRGLGDLPLEVPDGWRSLLGGGRPGAGGAPAPGGGAAELERDEEDPGLAERLEPRSLPPAEVLDPERAGLLAVRPVDPEEEDAGPVGEWAGLDTVPEGPAAKAWRRRLAPDHRRVVRRFFSEESNP